MDYFNLIKIMKEHGEKSPTPESMEKDLCVHIWLIDITHQVCKICGVAKDLDYDEGSWNLATQTQRAEDFMPLGTFIGADLTGTHSKLKRLHVWTHSKSKDGRGFLEECGKYITDLCEHFNIPKKIIDAAIYEIKRVYIKEKHCFRGNPKIGRFIYFIIACAFDEGYYNIDILGLLNHCNIKVKNYNKGLECLKKVDKDLPLYYIPTNIKFLLDSLKYINKELKFIDIIQRYNTDKDDYGKTRAQNVGKIVIFKMLKEADRLNKEEVIKFAKTLKISLKLLTKSI